MSGSTDAERREFGTHIVRELAAEIRCAFAAGSGATIDTALEQLFRDRLRGRFPDDLVIGEEISGPLSDERSPANVLWIVDPLDGTRNFLNGLPTFAVSVAAVHDDRLEHAWVLDVMQDTLWTARRGHGAWRGDRRFAVEDPSPPRELVHLSARWQQTYPVASAELVVRHRIRALGCVAIEMAQVADGTAAAGLWGDVHIWDIAAGLLLCSEAGVAVGQLGRHTLPGPRGPWRRAGCHTFHAHHPKWTLP